MSPQFTSPSADPPSFDGLNQVLDRCRYIIRDAGNIQARWKTLPGGRAEAVTGLDFAVESLLIDAIRQDFPAASIVAEETRLDLKRLDDSLCFVIDPIDGTRELIEGRDGYSISIAILERRRPVVAVLDFPARAQRFWARKDEGSFLNGRRISVTNVEKIHDLRLAISPNQARDPEFEAVLPRLEGITVIPTGSLASKLAGVACGLFDAACFFSWPGNRAPIWDFAAAALILHEAGGRFTDLEGSDLLQTMPDIQLGGWLASNGHCHHAVLPLIQNQQ